MTNLVLDKELDTLNGGGSGLGDSGGDTTHCGKLVFIHMRMNHRVAISRRRLTLRELSRTQEVNNESL